MGPAARAHAPATSGVTALDDPPEGHYDVRDRQAVGLRATVRRLVSGVAMAAEHSPDSTGPLLPWVLSGIVHQPAD